MWKLHQKRGVDVGSIEVQMIGFRQLNTKTNL